MTRRWAGSAIGRLRWWIGGFVLVAALAGAGGYLLLRAESAPAGELIAARMQGARWFEGRSTVGLPWAPYVADAAIDRPTELLGQLYTQADQYDAAAMALFLQGRREPGDLKRAKRELAGLPVSAARWNEQALLSMASGKDVDGLEAVEQGLLLEPKRPELLFTRAVLLERLYLNNQAIEAWQGYLALEHEGPWAVEARGRVERLRDPPPAAEKQLDQDAFDARIRALRSPEELDRLLADPATASSISALEAMGQRLYRLEIDYLRLLPRDAWPARVAAITGYRRDREAVVAGRSERARIDALAANGEPLVSLLYLRIGAYDAIQRSENERARRLLEEVIRKCAEQVCATDSTLARSDLGTLMLTAGDFQAAERAYAQALASLPANAHMRRAELLNKQLQLAMRTESWDTAESRGRDSLRFSILAGVDGRGPGAVAAFNLGVAAQAQGRLALAAAHLREALSLARMIGFARIEQKALAALAEVHQKLGQGAAAERMVDDALKRAEQTGLDSAVAAAWESLSRLRISQQRWDEAVVALDHGIDKLSDPSERSKLLGLRGAALRRKGELAPAARSLEDAVVASERFAATISDRLGRESAFAAAAMLRAELARVRAAEGDPDAVWSLLGRERRRALAEDECLLAQVNFKDGVGRWVAAAEQTRYLEVDRTAPVFGATGCPSTTRRLVLLDGAATAAVELSHAVRDERSDVALVLARKPAAPWPAGTAIDRAVAIHSPALAETDADYVQLPNARREAELILRTFPNGSELRGEGANLAALRQLAPSADLIHFAVHGQARSGAGAASYLVLSGVSQRLQVIDVLDLHLDRHPIVVLSACRGGGRSSDRERDGAGLPWAFLTAGARAVIATQDDLDDRVALRFSEIFYAALAGGEGVSPAFEKALETLRREWSPQVAASFTLFI